MSEGTRQIERDSQFAIVVSLTKRDRFCLCRKANINTSFFKGGVELVFRNTIIISHEKGKESQKLSEQ